MEFRVLLRWMRRHILTSAFVVMTLIFTIGVYSTGPQVFAANKAASTPISSMAAGGIGDLLGGSGGSSQVSSCALEQVGWIVCPVVRSVAKIADSAFTFITKDFLQVEVKFFDDSSSTSAVWSAMRNIANVLFVMAFLVVIYSLLTSTGISNYDLKRLVPRLFVAAILVNLSFFVCQLAVDIISVLGASIIDTIQGILGQGTTTGMPMDKARTDMQVLSEIADATLANSKVAWILLAPIVAVIFSAAIICSVILVILILRKVAVVALILVSPLAFVAYLLPNTEQYFTKWMKMFIHLLMIFPIISILLGTGQIVSAAIIKAEDSSQSQGYKQDGDEYTTTNGGGSKSATLRLIAAGAAILPLAGTWYAFKGMTALMDSAGVRIAQGRRGQGERTRTEKEASKREAAFDLSKKSQMLNGVNKIQQITAMQDGGSNMSLVGRIGGRRTYKKTMKSNEQNEFDSKVQNRLEELRGTGGTSPQQAYMQALQRYQDKQADIANGGGDGSLSINSYEGIDLKASEAYLLESLGKGGGTTLNNTMNVAAGAQGSSGAGGNGSGGNGSTGNKSGSAADDKKDDKKSAGLSSLNRDGKSGGGGGGGGDQPSDSYHAPTANSQAALTNALDSAGIASGSSAAGSAAAGPAQTIIVQGGGAPSGGGMSMEERRSSARQRPQAATGSELKAKARAAKYVSNSQDALFGLDSEDDGSGLNSTEQALKALMEKQNQGNSTIIPEPQQPNSNLTSGLSDNDGVETRDQG